MCERCAKVLLRKKILSPKEYEEIIEEISELITTDGFIVMASNCEIGKHKNEKGTWVSDTLLHTIQCPQCKQNFTCNVDTYHGGGTFRLGN